MPFSPGSSYPGARHVCDLVWVLSYSEVALGKQDLSLALSLLTCVCVGVTIIAPPWPEVVSTPEGRVSFSGPTPATPESTWPVTSTAFPGTCVAPQAAVPGF